MYEWTFFIFILITFLLAYSLGKYKGLEEGFKKGLAYAPIKLRKECLDKGVCPICNKKNEEGKLLDNNILEDYEL